MQDKTDKRAGKSLETCRVIVVSGNRFTCQLVRSLLPGMGIESAEVSHDLSGAQLQLSVSNFDLLIVDAGPAAGLDGLSLVEALRAMSDRIQAEAPVILLMTQPTKEQIERAQRSNIRHVIVKPFSPGALYSHVQRALDATPIESGELRQGFLGEGKPSGTDAGSDTGWKN